MAKFKDMNIKLLGSEKLSESTAKDILMLLKGSGGGMVYEIKKEIHRKIAFGEKFFLVKIESGIGGALGQTPAKRLEVSINNEWKKSDYNYRCRYSEERKGLIVVPEENYTQVFGKREKVEA